MFTKNEWIAIHLAQKNIDAETRMFFVLAWAKYVTTHSDQHWSKMQNITISHFLKYMPKLSAREYLLRKGEFYRPRHHPNRYLKLKH